MLFVEQALNGLQLGVMLFLMAAGVTLVIGIMNFVNLTHGSFYMLGAYFAATAYLWSHSFPIAVLAGIAAPAVIAGTIEFAIYRRLYARDHLDQVLCTFGAILFINEMTRIAWGLVPLRDDIPPFLTGNVELLPGLQYSRYRLAIIAVGLGIAVLLYVLVTRTRIGMLVRAGASDREMIDALGVDIDRLFTWVFAFGAGLAGLAGLMAGPLFSVDVGMGDQVLILTLVVIVIGGIGSVRGAFAGALLVGIIDTFGRLFLPSALATICIYLLMTAVVFWRPTGLFPAHVSR